MVAASFLLGISLLDTVPPLLACGLCDEVREAFAQFQLLTFFEKTHFDLKDCLREKSYRNVLAITCTSPSLLVAAAVIIDIIMARTQVVNR